MPAVVCCIAPEAALTALAMAEVRHRRVSIAQQNIARFDVPMDDSGFVRFDQCIDHVPERRKGFIDRQSSGAHQPIAQRLPLHKRHDVVEKPLSLTGIVERQDVRVLKLRGDVDLSYEAIGPHRCTQLRTQHLERHLAAVLEVLGKVDGGHPAGTELALDGVAVGESRLQSVELLGLIGHCAIPQVLLIHYAGRTRQGPEDHPETVILYLYHRLSILWVPLAWLLTQL
jgi:hypothetical protein